MHPKHQFSEYILCSQIYQAVHWSLANRFFGAFKRQKQHLYLHKHARVRVCEERRVSLKIKRLSLREINDRAPGSCVSLETHQCSVCVCVWGGSVYNYIYLIIYIYVYIYTIYRIRIPYTIEVYIYISCTITSNVWLCVCVCQLPMQILT